MREKGCSAVQEVGFTLANGIAYVQAALDAGLKVDEFGPRLAFFFNGHNNVFQEVAKFRAVRRMWARIMRERFGAENPRSMMVRFHTQTGGVTLAAQQAENNIVRVALQGFAAVCGGTQSLHTNGFDEALALPTERAARIALRTQQIIAAESGAADTVDPFAGSYFVESLTDEIEQRAQELIDKVDEMGGSVECIPFIRAEVEQSAWGYEERYRTKQDLVVGVNEYVTEDVDEVDILRVDPESEREQVERLKRFKDEPRPRSGPPAARGAARHLPRGRQPAAPDPGGAEGRLHARRGFRRDARGVRRIQGGMSLPARSAVGLVRLSGGVAEADLEPVVRRGEGEDVRHELAGVGRADAQAHERERAPGPHAAGAGDELADRTPQAAAARAALTLRLLDERLADPGADLLARDDLRESERGGGHGHELRAADELERGPAPVGDDDDAGEQGQVDGVQSRVVDGLGRPVAGLAVVEVKVLGGLGGHGGASVEDRSRGGGVACSR